MRRYLLSVGLLSSVLSVTAQTMHIDKKATVYTGDKSLVYNGGGFQTRGDGLFEVHGNVMIVGKSTDKFRTIEGTSDADKTAAGDNIVLKLNDPTKYDTSTYGQLYITGIQQDNMKAFVKKEYKATKHGDWQQMALPFYNKSLESLATELGSSAFSNQRANPSVMYADNTGLPQFHNLVASQSTFDTASRDADPKQNNNAARYYIVGTQGGWNPSAAVKTISGQLFSDVTPISYTLKGAGYEGTSPVPYGVGTGDKKSAYYEPVYSYLQDVWDYQTQGFFNKTVGSENGTYGRNIYQLANPFMTNIDLSMIGYDEDGNGSGDDKNTLCKVQSVRYGSDENSVVTSATGTVGVDRYITYTAQGVPTGDIKNALVKPMQAFAIKMGDNTCPDNQRVLNFNTLRRFAYHIRKKQSNSNNALNPYHVAAERNGNNSTVKQLRVVALDDNGNDIARTYFVVSKDFKTGVHIEAKAQVMSWNHSSIYTREELPTGGADLSDPYNTMYINEANEVDFAGKKMLLETKLANVKSYRFEIDENANSFVDGQSEFVDGGKSFYIEQTPGQFVKLAHNMVIPATASKSGLYFGVPEQTLSTGETNLKPDSELHIAFEKESNTHQVIFPNKWKKATVTIFDMAGRRISVDTEVDASKNFVLPLKVDGAYIVEVVSDKGVKAVKKIVK